MDKKDLEFFKNLLQSELDVLLEKADVAVGELVGESYNNEADPLDRATEERSRNDRIRMHDRESRLIAKIKKALVAIEEGTYGICEECEEPIGIARLKARPVTNYCINCKTKQEARERVVGD
ncbi:DksA2: RNA polymerase-binding transcription factor [Desulfosarcina variabilis str. Montpellier]|jgi:DnaK suppressor protein|uniref:RNA polymerase-binding protein DksA n=1 Tax=Desulfosarcina variabilis TaxID=2300 RepID=UPI003AFAF1EF